jgi:hypothetical protein
MLTIKYVMVDKQIIKHIRLNMLADPIIIMIDGRDAAPLLLLHLI